MHIQRHPIDRANTLERFQLTGELLQQCMPSLSERPDLLESVAWHARKLFAASSFLAPESGQLRHFARLGAQAGAVLFRFAAFPDVPVRATVGDSGPLDLAWYHPRTKDDADSLIYTYAFAAMTRDQAVLDMLADVPVEITRHSQAVTDEFCQLYAAALQSYHRQDGHTHRLLDAGRAAAAPERVEIAGPEAVRMTVCLMDALEALQDRDEQRFNQALYDAVSVHKQRFNDGDMTLDFEGFVDRDALGLACLAHDAGLAVRVDSGYLPRAVILDRYVD